MTIALPSHAKSESQETCTEARLLCFQATCTDIRKRFMLRWRVIFRKDWSPHTYIVYSWLWWLPKKAAWPFAAVCDKRNTVMLQNDISGRGHHITAIVFWPFRESSLRSGWWVKVRSRCFCLFRETVRLASWLEPNSSRCIQAFSQKEMQTSSVSTYSEHLTPTTAAK